MHEATPTGQPSSLARALSCPSSPSTSILTRTRAMQAKAGLPVDPDTLEPLDLHHSPGGSMTMLVEAGVDVALSMDLLRHAGPGGECRAAVVLTARSELSEALQMASGACDGRVWICGLSSSLHGALAGRSKVSRGAELS